MQKKIRLFVSLMLMMLLITSVSSEAAIVSFTKVHVDSNSFNIAVGGTKAIGGDDEGKLYISNIYKSDGSASNYSAVYAKTTYSAPQTLVSKGVNTTLKIYPGMLEEGDYVPVYMKGRNSALDCKVSGTWNPR